jgi:putative oxidoreductase
MSDGLAPLSRVLLSPVFIVAGAYKMMDPTGILNNPGTKRFMELVASGTAPPTWLGYLIAAIELLGGLAILVGFQTRLAAWGLFIWVIVATYLGHAFALTEITTPGPNQANFLKNLAIMGGLLLLASSGPGHLSVDGRGSNAHA